MSFKKRISVWAPVFLWMLVIFSLSAQTSDESSALSGAILLRILSVVERVFVFMPINIMFSENVLRKMAHFAVYALLGTLTYRSVKEEVYLANRNTFLTAMLLCTLYAVSDEWHQLYVPGRAASGIDVLIDALGAVTGISIARWLYLTRWTKRANI